MLAKPPLGKYPLFDGCSCEGCPLEVKGSGFALPDGLCTNSVLMVGEALGSTEAQQGKPFVGQAGYQLSRTLARTKFQRESFGIFNVVNCQPPKDWLDGAPWEHTSIAQCDQYLRRVVLHYKPKVIVTLGSIPTRTVLGRSEGIMKLRGYVYEANVYGHDCFVVPSHHPSSVMRGIKKVASPFSLTGVSIFDLQRAARVAKNGYAPPREEYIENPTEADLESFCQEAEAHALGGHLFSDIETYSTGVKDEDEYGEIADVDIIRISFSLRPHTGITMTWTQ